jgi:hypothetical protein
VSLEIRRFLPLRCTKIVKDRWCICMKHDVISLHLEELGFDDARREPSTDDKPFGLGFVGSIHTSRHDRLR